MRRTYPGSKSRHRPILGDPGADSGAEDENQNGREKIRRAKVRKKNTSPWGKFSAQSGASIRSAVWNWCVKSSSPGARIFFSYFCSSNFFPPVLIFVFGPTICPWVSEDGTDHNSNKWLLSSIALFYDIFSKQLFIM